VCPAYVCCPISVCHGPYRRKLLEARRDRHDYEVAKRSYDLARGQFHAVLGPWSNEEQLQIEQSRHRLEQISQRILQKASSSIDQVIEKTLKDWSPGDTQSQSGFKGQSSQRVSIERKEVSVLSYGFTLMFVKHVDHRVLKF
jgi:hypothetical protein